MNQLLRDCPNCDADGILPNGGVCLCAKNARIRIQAERWKLANHRRSPYEAEIYGYALPEEYQDSFKNPKR